MNKYSKDMKKYPTKQSNNNQKQRINNRQQQQRTAHWNQISRSHAEPTNGAQTSAGLLRTKGTVPFDGPPPSVQPLRLGLAELPGGLHCAAEDLRKVIPTLSFQNSTTDTNNMFPESKIRPEYINISSKKKKKNMEIQTINDHTTLGKRSR